MNFKVSQSNVDELYLDKAETLIIFCGKYIEDNKYKIPSESASFCRRCDKTFILLCVLGFAVPIAVHLQNVNSGALRGGAMGAAAARLALFGSPQLVKLVGVENFSTVQTDSHHGSGSY